MRSSHEQENITRITERSPIFSDARFWVYVRTRTLHQHEIARTFATTGRRVASWQDPAVLRFLSTLAATAATLAATTLATANAAALATAALATAALATAALAGAAHATAARATAAAVAATATLATATRTLSDGAGLILFVWRPNCTAAATGNEHGAGQQAG